MNHTPATSRSAATRGCAPASLVPARHIAAIADIADIAEQRPLRPGDVRTARKCAAIR